MLFSKLRKRRAESYAKIVNRGECHVRLGQKQVILSMDWLPDMRPAFVVYLHREQTWDVPAGTQITELEKRSIEAFLPNELLENDGVLAIVERS
jgi:hypothetical protein